MTSYSVMPTGCQSTIVATWSGQDRRDHSVKITTLADHDQARELAHTLTRLSEGAWNAAAWLDTSPVIEAAVTSLVEQLRGPTAEIHSVEVTTDDHRHVEAWSFYDVCGALEKELPDLLNGVTRAQRLTLADEIAHDAASRAEGLQHLPQGLDPESARSRVWQMGEVTRSLRNGQIGRLPEAGASWLVRTWGEDRSPAERWGARDQLLRMEQLVAACKAHGGRAAVEDDVELEAHIVIPRSDRSHASDVYYVRVADKGLDPWDINPFEPVTVIGYLDEEREKRVLGHLEPIDNDGFAKLLGEWTRSAPPPMHMGRLVD